MENTEQRREANVPTDKLLRARHYLAELRNLELEKSNLEEELKSKNKALYELQHKTLPDLFTDSGIDTLAIPPEGNEPGYVAKLHPHFHANIQAGWDEDRRAEAFQWLDENGYGDLVKTIYTITFPRAARKPALDFKKMLEEAGISFSVDVSVPWKTLTAFVKERLKSGEVLPLETLGATVGQIVEVKKMKEK